VVILMRIILIVNNIIVSHQKRIASLLLTINNDL
jgi:hypothetical protein